MAVAGALSRRLLARAGGLCAVAGFVDAIGYTELGGVFAANMTGNSVLMAIVAMRGDWARAASYATTLAAFLFAAILASALRRATGRPALALGAGALLLLVASQPMAPALRLILLAAAMGAQGAAVSRFGPLTLQTVVVTGTMVRLADGLAARFFPAGERVSSDGPRLDGAAWGAYVTGAAVAVGVSHIAGRPLLAAAIVLALIAFDVARDGAAAW